MNYLIFWIEMKYVLIRDKEDDNFNLNIKYLKKIFFQALKLYYLFLNIFQIMKTEIPWW